MSVVQYDGEGIYLVVNGSRYRPGNVRGYSHNPNNDMSDGGLCNGNHVKVRHISGTPLCRIKLDSGKELLWHTEYRP